MGQRNPKKNRVEGWGVTWPIVNVKRNRGSKRYRRPGSVLNWAVGLSWSRTTTDDITSSRSVSFQTCSATHHQGLSPTVPRDKCLILAVLPSPAVPLSHSQSPRSLMVKVTGDHSFFSCYFCILSFYALVLYLLLYCFLCFWCFSLSLAFLRLNPVWINRT